MSQVSRVIVKLKPKVASLGFSRLEVEGAASRIASNLAEDASDEDIDAAIDAVLPYLELAQTSANRIINKAKDGEGNKSTTATGESKKAEKSSENGGKQANENGESAGANLHNVDELKKVLGGIVSDALSPITKRLEAIEGGKIADSRLAQVQEIAKKAGGMFEKNILKTFNRMTFESDEDFQSYLDETKADVDTYVQENSNEGLGKSPKPKGASGGSKDAIDPVLQERINERKAETVAPAIAGLPENK
nr:hypothetical protein [uncultured Alistipes sp.]